MELRATSVLLLVCVTFIILTSTEGSIPRCCVRVSTNIPKHMLRFVSEYKVQRKSGVCEIDAVVLFIKNKWICADLKVLKRLKKLKKHHKPKRN